LIEDMLRGHLGRVFAVAALERFPPAVHEEAGQTERPCWARPTARSSRKAVAITGSITLLNPVAGPAVACPAAGHHGIRSFDRTLADGGDVRIEPVASVAAHLGEASRASGGPDGMATEEAAVLYASKGP